ncbi:MAG: phosphoenolpyruvate carboxykinase (ATP), partial [Clostridia bacterium]|nr:phosphoenolpyruvate carboxykinase (ATP) [Clostridia bacterium]
MSIQGLEKLGITNAKTIYRNLTPARLTEEAVIRGEGTLSNKGALVVKTGKFTGRSAKDKFIVDAGEAHDNIAWGSVNMPVSQERFDTIKAKVIAYLQNRDLFVFDGFAGADPKYTKKFRVINELASQNLFIRDLLIRPTAEELENYGEPF